MTLQPEALRRHAVPVAAPVPGIPLVKSTANLGRMLERRRVRVPVDAEMPQERRKTLLFKAARQFITEEGKRDRAEYRFGMEVHGPFPHFEPQSPDIQIGDRGGTRPRARSIADDTSAESGLVDYVLEATFSVPEYVNEIPTDLALELFSRPGGRPGLRPLRESEWRGIARG